MDEPTPVLAGTPVSRKAQRRLGLAKFIPAPGSAKATCQKCATKIWLGPRQGKFAKEHPGALVYCVRCAALLGMFGPGDQPKVASLGGPGATYFMEDGTIYAPKTDKN